MLSGGLGEFDGKERWGCRRFPSLLLLLFLLFAHSARSKTTITLHPRDSSSISHFHHPRSSSRTIHPRSPSSPLFPLSSAYRRYLHFEGELVYECACEWSSLNNLQNSSLLSSLPLEPSSKPPTIDPISELVSVSKKHPLFASTLCWSQSQLLWTAVVVESWPLATQNVNNHVAIQLASGPGTCARQYQVE